MPTFVTALLLCTSSTFHSKIGSNPVIIGSARRMKISAILSTLSPLGFPLRLLASLFSMIKRHYRKNLLAGLSNSLKFRPSCSSVNTKSAYISWSSHRIYKNISKISSLDSMNNPKSCLEKAWLEACNCLSISKTKPSRSKSMN